MAELLGVNAELFSMGIPGKVIFWRQYPQREENYSDVKLPKFRMWYIWLL